MSSSNMRLDTVMSNIDDLEKAGEYNTKTSLYHNIVVYRILLLIYLYCIVQSTYLYYTM